MADDYRAAFHRSLRRELVPQLGRIAQFQSRWFSPPRLATERALGDACVAGRNVARTSGLLRPPSHRYQGYAGPWIEDYFLSHWLQHSADSALGYLPVFWTDIFLHAQTHRFTPGQYDRFQRELRRLLDVTLAVPRCFFTLLEYDHMIWDWHLFPRNIAVFSAGGWGDVPIPLLKGSPPYTCPPKEIPLSFVGRIDGASDAGGVRSQMHAALREGALFTSGPHWRDVMARSTFSLCPRGLGRASFRLYEALSVGSIPIYLWDDVEWLPYREELDWAEFSISLPIGRVSELPEILRSYSPERIDQMQRRIAQVYASHFTLPGACEQILHTVERLADPGRFRRLMEARPYLPDTGAKPKIPDFLRT
jgi:hypothetical protein